MRVVSIIGGRPNIIKAEPIHHGLLKAEIQHDIIDIGVFQKHYGKKMYRELDLPDPAIILKQSPTENYLTSQGPMPEPVTA